MTTDLFVPCKCGKPIRFLVANPLQIAADPKAWPTDGTELFLECPSCNQVSVHSQAYSRDFPEDTCNLQKAWAWFRISFRCAIEGCDTPVEFHVLRASEGKRRTEVELYDKLRTTPWIGASRCHHPIAIGGNKKPVIGPVSSLEGYRPDHSHWDSIK